jgi:YD repeat-containing protein
MRVHVFATFVTLLLGGLAAHAQNDFEKGFQAYQSYHGSDFDTVNLANGNLVLDIPLISYEQRGGLPPITVSVRSNSTTFQSSPPYQNGPPDTKQYEVPSGIVGAPWGQPHVVISPGGLYWKEQRVTTSSHTGGGGPEYLSRFVAYDDSGATHSLGGNIANLTQGLVPGIKYSVDGSGLMLQPGSAPAGPLLVDRKGNVGGLIDPFGNGVSLLGPATCVKPLGSGDFYDASVGSWEGYAHGVASATSITDSIGRTIPNPSYVPPVYPYSCLVDMYQSYFPASAASGAVPACETWQFPAQASQGNSTAVNSGTVPIQFCYKQISVSAQIPAPLAQGSPIAGGGGNTSACSQPIQGASNAYSCVTINETWWVLSYVTLPNGRQWAFNYDSYGQVQDVQLPTGADVSYQYQTRIACGNPPGEIPVTGTPVWPYSNIMSTRMVTARTLDLHDGTPAKTWNYNSTIGSGWAGSPNQGTVTVTDPEQNDTVHTFTLQGAYASQQGATCGPYETETTNFQGSAPPSSSTTPMTNALKDVQTTYTNTGVDYANPTNFSNYIPTGVFPREVTTTMFQLPSAFIWNTVPFNTTVSKIDSSTYDQFGTYQDYIGNTHPFSLGQVLASCEANWGGSCDPAAGHSQVVKTELHTYLWQSNWSYYQANLIDLPCLDTVIQGFYGGTQTSCNTAGALSLQAAQTAYGYDESAYLSGTQAGSSPKGSLTSVSRWLNTRGTPVATHNLYGSQSMGMPVGKIDANGNTTWLWYDASGLFLNKIQHPTTSANGLAVGHIEYPTYDDDTGLLLSNKDENGQITRYTYDSMRRLRRVDFPDTGWETYAYNDSAPANYNFNAPSNAYALTYQKAIDPVRTYTAYGIVDELGRVRQTQIAAAEGNITKDTYYDRVGRVIAVSNPYVPNPTPLDPPYGFVSYAYDGLGRKILQCQQDNGQTKPAACVPGGSYIQWIYTGAAVATVDELGKTWWRAYDGAGRLYQAQNISAANIYGAKAYYAYDALGNLTNVDQWAVTYPSFTASTPHLDRQRSFSYDSLSRLVTSTNPETGTVCYGLWSGSTCNGSYDDNGNLLAKTDARGISIQYRYDPLNRLLSKFYGNDPGSTPASCYQYDVPPPGATPGNFIGRLASAWTQHSQSSCGGAPTFPSSAVLSARSIQQYDSMGRIRGEQQCTASNCNSGRPYAVTYDYDLAGNLLHHNNGVAPSFVSGGSVHVNPHAMSFTNCYDQTNRLTLVAAVNTSCAAPVFSAADGLFTMPAYSPAGGLTSATFGAGLGLTRTYDNRLRVVTEQDTGSQTPQSPTPASATVQILGTVDKTH